jgi:hypothetical protein
MKAAKIDKLQEQLEAKASEIIAAKMEVLESRLQISIRSLDQTVDSVQERLRDGDHHFKGVDERNQKLELKTQEMVSSLRADMATKQDVQQIRDQLQKLQLALAASEAARIALCDGR